MSSWRLKSDLFQKHKNDDEKAQDDELDMGKRYRSTGFIGSGTYGLVYKAKKFVQRVNSQAEPAASSNGEEANLEGEYAIKKYLIHLLLSSFDTDLT